jgi:hypothetical protein
MLAETDNEDRDNGDEDLGEEHGDGEEQGGPSVSGSANKAKKKKRKKKKNKKVAEVVGSQGRSSTRSDEQVENEATEPKKEFDSARSIDENKTA